MPQPTNDAIGYELLRTAVRKFLDTPPRRIVPPITNISESYDRLDLERSIWWGQSRDYSRYVAPPTWEARKTAAREAGLILCDCIWVNAQLVIWVPTCQAHGGGCPACKHRHVHLYGE